MGGGTVTVTLPIIGESNKIKIKWIDHVFFRCRLEQKISGLPFLFYCF